MTRRPSAQAGGAKAVHLGPETIECGRLDAFSRARLSRPGADIPAHQQSMYYWTLRF